MSAPKQRHVFLIGFMGAGKTTVGKVLAQRLGWSFHDLDQLIEQRERRSIAAIFSDAGESGFRNIESAALLELLENGLGPERSVIALGGGAFLQSDNREAVLRAGAITVLLKAPVLELQQRCQRAGAIRPLAGDKTKFEQLFASRQQHYALAQFHVETGGKGIEQVAQEIEQIVRNQKSE